MPLPLRFLRAAALALGLLGPGAMTWFLDTGGIYLGIVWVLVVATKYLLPRRFPHIRREYTAPGWAPILGALGAVLVIVLALLPGTNMSLVWPGEYIVLVVWFVIGGILLATSGKMGKDEALTELLGPYKAQLDESLSRGADDATGPAASGTTGGTGSSRA